MRSAVTLRPHGWKATLVKATLVVAGIAALVAPAIADLSGALLVESSSQSTVLPVASTEFDVASIKLNVSDGQPPLNPVVMTFLRSVAHSQSNGRFTMRGMGATPVSVLIQAAYDVKEFQILGAPAWSNSDRYDVDARAGEAATFDRMRPMLRSLLADRFALMLRRETRQLPVYELVPARDGLKIAPMKEGGCVGKAQAKPFAALDICGGMRRQIVSLTPERRDLIEAVGVPMPTLIEFLSDEVGRVVIDKTGFTDLFSFRLEFGSTLAAGFLPNADSPAALNSPGLSIFTAVEEQLGVRLRSVIGRAEVLVIDRLERPSPN
jgi:uncharacterized protein (TIGR03435 family)